MQFSTKQIRAEKLRTDCVVVPVQAGSLAGATATAIDKALGGILRKTLSTGDLGKRAGTTQLLPLDGDIRRVLLVSVGEDDKAGERAFVDACSAAFKALAATAGKDAVVLLHDALVAGRGVDWKLQRAVRYARETAYRFDRMKSSPEPAPGGPTRIAFGLAGGEAGARKAVQQAVALANGMELAKDLGNLPGNVCTPRYLADAARKLGRASGMKVQILDEKRMRSLNMGSLLSVARGSDEPPRLIVLEYRGAPASQAPVVLVGKGITFDTGGISLKPGASMDEMKFDMCGAASVLGTLRAIAEIKPKINVVGIVAAAENMPSGRATKPGDIVTSMSGRTIEILNTDAEGRLVLCDALTYAERFKPAAVIDIATLTGACVVALGHHNSGLFAREDDLAESLLAAGRETGDRCWRMPLDEEYDEQLKSPFADVANIGGRDAGAVTAACFLARFTKAYPWAHLDIAGTAWQSGAAKGASGRPVPLLTRFVLARAGA